MVASTAGAVCCSSAASSAGEKPSVCWRLFLTETIPARIESAVTYFKQSDHIEELLTRIGAPAAAMEVMAAKVEKEMRNTVNRRVNCDAANVDKAVAASREQVEALTRLTDAGIVATLPVKLQEVAVARLLQPELSLSELAETFDPPLTKSCLNHRMRKLMELAGKEKA